MPGIINNIKAKMEEHNISAHALEKKAGLRPSAIHNILYGRSKKPSINVIQSIAAALNCSVSEILESYPSTDVMNPLEKKGDNLNWDPELYLKCFNVVWGLVKESKHQVSKVQFLEIVEEIYIYSSKDENKKDVDKKFSKWLFDKTFKKTY